MDNEETVRLNRKKMMAYRTVRTIMKKAMSI
jgi:hypothetical protein